MSWAEALTVVLVCWLLSGLGYAVFAALDEPGLAVAPLLGVGLVRWFWARHRVWPAAVAGAVAGLVVLFGAVDLLRPGRSRYVADALATGLGATAALVVFALACRVRVPAGDRNP
ncbi:hypothetical protein [Streptomyces griseoflavus]|uniref:hypothetical protein n=1 Tax=Streptomyces griseoflavus TaxID=35619 RepID=UPI00167E041C|nr:hypothetical protein [Streptomyces griseoflavus]